MGWLQLDPQSIAARTKESGAAASSLGQSLGRGITGFTILSVAGFAPWALGGRWFYRNIGEAGLYAVCAIVFIGLSGLLLHRLIIGPGSLLRFYKFFSVAFAVYAVAWTAGWMALRGHTGSIVGLFAGAVLMGLLFKMAFNVANTPTIMAITVLFSFTGAGYFIGGLIEANVAAAQDLFGLNRGVRVTIAKLLWGVCYGIGFGAALGLSFHISQREARVLLASTGKA